MKKLLSALIIISLSVSLFAYAESDYSDWAKDYIDTALSVGILPQDMQNNYKNDITRLEFANIAVSLISRLYGVSEDILTKDIDTSVFKDTNDKNVSVAYAFGIVEGDEYGYFNPQNSITRQEAAKILVCTYYSCIGNTLPLSDKNADFTDYATSSDWAKPYISTVCELSIMTGTEDGSFLPFDTYTKEQAIITFIRIYNLIKDNDLITPKFNNKNPEITDSVTTKDGRLYAGDKEVILNGINLGGWLIMESWMCPLYDPKAEIAYSDILSILNKRFGKEKTNELIKTYQDNFITENDFKIIEGLGFNCVRIPFWYKNFTDNNGNIIKNSDGYKYIDFALEQCKKHNLYAILDMHGCPGGQSVDHSTGTIGKNELYDNKKNLDIMESLWVDIAKHYKDNKYVLAYDIMNEPQNNGGKNYKNAWEPESEEAVSRTNSVYDRMIKAIRAVDKDHLISVEGIWTLNVLPNPTTMGWTNMLYQLHLYDTTEGMIDYRISECTTSRDDFDIACLVGEYNNKSFEKLATSKYIDNKISRIKWTYKTLSVNYDGWGLYDKDFKKLDINTALYTEIRDAFKSLSTNFFKLNLLEYNMIK